MGEDETMQPNKECTSRKGAGGSISADGKWQRTLEIIREANKQKWKMHQINEINLKHNKRQRVLERNKGA